MATQLHRHPTGAMIRTQVALATAIGFLLCACAVPAALCLRLLWRRQHWSATTVHGLMLPLALAAAVFGIYAAAVQLR